MLPAVFIRRYIRIIVSSLILLAIVLIAIFAENIATHDPYAINMFNTKQPPNDIHIMGTDVFGRDIFSRVIYGTRISLFITILVNSIAIALGTVIGLFAGYYRTFDKIAMRIMEGISALPMLLLAIILVSVLGNGTGKIIACLTIVNLPGISRLVRSLTLSIKEKEHVESAKAIGASDIRIIFKYILPLCVSPLIIRFTQGLAATILTQASLSFLGIGLDPTIPSWGGIISEGKTMVMVYPYMCAYPGFAIIITVMAFAILGDGLRDVLDPKLR